MTVWESQSIFRQMEQTGKETEQMKKRKEKRKVHVAKGSRSSSLAAGSNQFED